jgi:hypothetical protein
VRIDADGSTVFNLIAGVELWPALFGHVRSARVLRRDGKRRLIAVRARWHGLPLDYTAIQTVDADRQQMTIRHVSRLTRGSVATWAVVAAPGLDSTNDPGDAVDVRVHQQVIVPVPMVGGLLARQFVGGRIARDQGQAMLDRLKVVAEGGSLAGRY